MTSIFISLILERNSLLQHILPVNLNIKKHLAELDLGLHIISAN